MVEAARAQGQADGWTSAFTRIGTAHDKRMSHHHEGVVLSYREIANLWASNDITATAIEAPSKECFREGYQIVINDEGNFDGLKEDIDEKLLELCVDAKLELALQYRRAYGGGAILLGAMDGRTLDKPVNPDQAMFELDWLNVLEPIQLYPAQFYNNPLGKKFNDPELYQLNPQPRIGYGPTTASSQNPTITTQYIHESRLVAFQGIQTSIFNNNSLNQVSSYWGASMVPRFYEWMRDHGIAFSGAGLLSTDVSQPVITIQGLKQLVGKNEKQLHDRMAALELGRSVARAIMLDSDEKFERQTTQLAGIPDLLDRMSQRLAAAVGIPLSVLLGYSPATLGSPSNNEITQWHNQIRAMQRREIEPMLRYIITLIMKSLRQRKLPQNWHIHWNDLERPTENEQAESRLTNARTASLLVKSGIVWCDEVRDSQYRGGYSQNIQINEKRKAPGFLSPIPTGVMPGAQPAGGAPGQPVGPNVHTVGGYVRGNPTEPALGANPKVGGDVPPGQRSDAALYTAAAEAAAQHSVLDRLKAAGGTPAMVKLLEDVCALADQEALACADGTCGPDCTYDHPTRATADSIDEFAIVEHLDRIEQRGTKWVVMAQEGNDVLGEFATEEEAVHRLAQIEYFKSHAR